MRPYQSIVHCARHFTSKQTVTMAHPVSSFECVKNAEARDVTSANCFQEIAKSQ